MKILFEKWWKKGNKKIGLIYYPNWDRPHYQIYTNGGKKKNGDKCFDFIIDFGYLHFSYTNFNLQGTKKNSLKIENCKSMNVPNRVCSYQEIAEADCDGDIKRCKDACHKQCLSVKE